VSITGVGEGKKVAVLGSKRCLVVESSKDVMLPSELSVKKEALGEVVMFKKQSLGVVAKYKDLRIKVLNTPNWLEVEVGENKSNYKEE
jgi:hypothetical protein